eukprot:gb/GEZJ01004115.1/.p1 GENE.gb/GEZJ01004115.1/~~gb/GEZJ01004115.1/.p1  ORF type:complete len:114 (-),score=1.80 gb/GEZJ01004115.1/:517-858(-)
MLARYGIANFSDMLNPPCQHGRAHLSSSVAVFDISNQPKSIPSSVLYAAVDDSAPVNARCWPTSALKLIFRVILLSRKQNCRQDISHSSRIDRDGCALIYGGGHYAVGIAAGD